LVVSLLFFKRKKNAPKNYRSILSHFPPHLFVLNKTDIAYSNLSPEIEGKSKLIAMGISYYLLDMGVRGMLLVSVVGYPILFLVVFEYTLFYVCD
jgi:hypothetical protein